MNERSAAPSWRFDSAAPAMRWPALSAPAGAAVLSLLQQLDDTQWLSAETLAELQLRQLQVVLRHAHDTVPFYRQHWADAYRPGEPASCESVARLPLLPRHLLQDHFDGLKSTRVPAEHGPVTEAKTSGSTGAPVRVLKPALVGLFWNAFTLRDHIWHRRDLRGKLAAIRATSNPGEFANWGAATHGLLTTGPSVVLGIRDDIRDMLSWLDRHQPDYLVTYPSILRELLKQSDGQGVRLARLREVRTFAEMLSPEIRELCTERWHAPLVDMYSAEEVGYIALQCPAGRHYHVQAEGLYVEVIDDAGRPCRPGEVGRLVVSTLHNFAMPLVRYVIGDYAQVGGACACGRGLPVLERIMGRVNNMLATADGKRYWPMFGMRKFAHIGLVRQHQFVQKSLDLVEARLVTEAPLSPEQEAGLRQHVQALLPPGVGLAIAYRDSIPRGSGGKFEDFVSELPV